MLIVGALFSVFCIGVVVSGGVKPEEEHTADNNFELIQEMSKELDSINKQLGKALLEIDVISKQLYILNTTLSSLQAKIELIQDGVGCSHGWLWTVSISAWIA